MGHQVEQPSGIVLGNVIRLLSVGEDVGYHPTTGERSIPPRRHHCGSSSARGGRMALSSLRRLPGAPGNGVCVSELAVACVRGRSGDACGWRGLPVRRRGSWPESGLGGRAPPRWPERARGMIASSAGGAMWASGDVHRNLAMLKNLQAAQAVPGLACRPA